MQKQQVKDVPGWVRSLYLFSQTKELWQNSILIPYSLIKGDALSYLAYQSLGRRKYSDIDIIAGDNFRFMARVPLTVCSV